MNDWLTDNDRLKSQRNSPKPVYSCRRSWKTFICESSRRSSSFLLVFFRCCGLNLSAARFMTDSEKRFSVSRTKAPESLIVRSSDTWPRVEFVWLSCDYTILGWNLSDRCKHFYISETFDLQRMDLVIQSATSNSLNWVNVSTIRCAEALSSLFTYFSLCDVSEAGVNRKQSSRMMLQRRSVIQALDVWKFLFFLS